MTIVEQKWKQAAQKSFPVYLFYSVDSAQAQQAAAATLRFLGSEDNEVTTIYGPAPSVEEITLAAGTISFFSTKRLIYLPLVKTSAYGAKDFEDFCSILRAAENAVLVITMQISEKWGKVQLNKSEQKLIKLCESIGFAQLLAKPGTAELGKMVQQRAENLGSTISAKATTALLERCGQDQLLLQNEVDKLAAYSGYREITAEMVYSLGTRSLDADVFNMIEQIKSGFLLKALQQLNVLLQMQSEPIAIAGALTSSYLDLYRISCAKTSGKSLEALQKDFSYSSVYRLQKIRGTAQKYQKKQLLQSLMILQNLDKMLKSSPKDRSSLYLQKALCELAECGARR